MASNKPEQLVPTTKGFKDDVGEWKVQVHVTPPRLSMGKNREKSEEENQDNEDSNYNNFAIPVLPTPSKRTTVDPLQGILPKKQKSEFYNEISYIIIQRIGLVAVYFTVAWGKKKGQCSYIDNFRKLAEETEFGPGRIDPSKVLPKDKCWKFPLLYGPYSQVHQQTKQIIYETKENGDQYPKTVFLMIPNPDPNTNLISLQSIEQDVAEVADIGAMIEKHFNPQGRTTLGLAFHPNSTTIEHKKMTLDCFVTRKGVVQFVEAHWKMGEQFYGEYTDLAKNLFEMPYGDQWLMTKLGYPSDADADSNPDQH